LENYPFQYKVAKAESKKLVKRDKINRMNDDLDEIGNLPSDKQFFLAMKRLNTPKRNIIWGSKDKNGKILTSKDGILERWASFYQDLYDDQNSHNEINIPDNIPDIPSVTTKKYMLLSKNLEQVKVQALTVSTHWQYPLLNSGGETLIKIPQKLFNLIQETGETPTYFKKAVIVVLFKKGDRWECKNYRPISLLSHIYKLFMTIIGARIIDDL